MLCASVCHYGLYAPLCGVAVPKLRADWGALLLQGNLKFGANAINVVANYLTHYSVKFYYNWFIVDAFFYLCCLSYMLLLTI